MKIVHIVAFILVVVGGINWLLNVFAWDIANWFGGSAWAMIVKIIYVLVGLSAIYLAATHNKDCKGCEASTATPSAPQA